MKKFASVVLLLMFASVITACGHHRNYGGHHGSVDQTQTDNA